MEAATGKEDESSGLRLLWESIGKSSPLIFGLLPAMGYLIREWSLELANIQPATRVALAASISELTATGALTLLVAGAAAILASLFSLRYKVGDRVARKLIPSKHGARVALLPIFLLAPVALLLFLPGWPMVLLAFAGSIPLHFFARRLERRQHATSLAKNWPIVLLAMLIFVPAAVIVRHGETAGYITFSDEMSAPANGWFTRLGADGDGFYLRPCAGRNRVTFVATRAIQSIEFREAPNDAPSLPSLWNDLFGGASAQLGLQFRCPNTLLPQD